MLSGNGEPGTSVRAPEELTENILTPVCTCAASSSPVGLNATCLLLTLYGEPGTGVSAPEALTENTYRESGSASFPVVTASRPPLGLNVTEVGKEPTVNGEPSTGVRAPEELTEKSDTVPLLSFAAARSVPLGLKATELADGSGGDPPTGVRAPEAPTENMAVPLASRAPLGLNAKPDPPLMVGVSGVPGAGV